MRSFRHFRRRDQAVIATVEARAQYIRVTLRILPVCDVEPRSFTFAVCDPLSAPAGLLVYRTPRANARANHCDSRELAEVQVSMMHMI